MDRLDGGLRERCRREIRIDGRTAAFWSLPALGDACSSPIERLPVCLRLVLESLLRNCDGLRVTEANVRELAAWLPNAPRSTEVPFPVGRVVLQDAAGIPLLGDLAAMRAAAVKMGLPAASVSLRVPVALVVDHSLTVEHHATPDALRRNASLEIERNRERFEFLKWAASAFRGIRLIPPGFGILHQLNLELLGGCLLSHEGAVYPDSLVGTDSHTGMVGALGVVGWGVGGIEAESAMLGRPINFLTPDVVGVRLLGAVNYGVTATDVVLRLTQYLRSINVVGQFVEFFGEGVSHLSIPDRATIANMAPEYGATLGFFPFDGQTGAYLRSVGRMERDVLAVEEYLRAQRCLGSPEPHSVDYTRVVNFDLTTVQPNVAGPKRPQDCVALADLPYSFDRVVRKPVAEGGYGKDCSPIVDAASGKSQHARVAHGDILIAAITSCTNTSNPGLMLAAGLVAKKAFECGLRPKPWVKTSLAPGSIVVGKYLAATGLQRYLDALGFGIVGFGCATCVGNSGPIDPDIERAVIDDDVVACAVLSGNRNFEARIHRALRAAYLMSPPLVVAFALAGTVCFDFEREPLGFRNRGQAIFLRDIWPTAAELQSAIAEADNRTFYQDAYQDQLPAGNPMWHGLQTQDGELFDWDRSSTYIVEPPFLKATEFAQSSLKCLEGGRALAILGDSVTTDHISPIGAIDPRSPAGKYLIRLGVSAAHFNTFGARRMNHEVMVRGTLANPRLRNAMVDVEGGMTSHQPSGERMTIFDAAVRYAREDVPLIVVAGSEYGTGSSRDWAAKGLRLLGVRAVVASSFERIHRSNLVGMGVLPCELPPGVTARTLGLDGSETFCLAGLDHSALPRQPISLAIERQNGTTASVPLTLRIDTFAELEYVRQGGLLSTILMSCKRAA